MVPRGFWKIVRHHALPLLGPPSVGLVLWSSAAVADRFALSGGASWVPTLTEWLVFPPSLVVVGLVGWIVGAPLYLWGWYTAGLPRQFTQAWEGTVSYRRALRDFLPPAHAKWTGAPSSFTTVTQFIAQAVFPAGLPLARGELRHYAARAHALWFGERKALLDFCLALYPAHGESPLLTPDQRRQLYIARVMLAKFWDEWGRRCYEEESIAEGILRPRLHPWELTVLTYLEVALALRNNEQFAGKRGLFRLGREVARHTTL